MRAVLIGSSTHAFRDGLASAVATPWEFDPAPATWASPELAREVREDWVKLKGHTYEVQDSTLKSALMPTYQQYLEKKHLYQ